MALGRKHAKTVCESSRCEAGVIPLGPLSKCEVGVGLLPVRLRHSVPEGPHGLLSEERMTQDMGYVQDFFTLDAVGFSYPRRRGSELAEFWDFEFLGVGVSHLNAFPR